MPVTFSGARSTYVSRHTVPGGRTLRAWRSSGEEPCLISLRQEHRLPCVVRSASCAWGSRRGRGMRLALRGTGVARRSFCRLAFP